MVKMFLVAVSGCSSSGKTTIAKIIAKLCPEITLIHEDDFYKHDEEVPYDEKRHIRNWDSPDALDLTLFGKELDTIKETGEISSQLVHNNNVDDISKFNLDYNFLKSLKMKLSEVSRKWKIVLVDGFMIYNSTALTAKFDLKLFFTAPYEVLKARRNARPGYQTLDSYWVDPPYYFDEFVYKSYKASHEPLFINGNVEGELNPETAPGIKRFVNGSHTLLTHALEWVTDEICKAASAAL
ncbi:NRK1 (YNL129W) [Zygosaccharomyces parabailii]|nr:NRK1 (YNL129W) [Zygosaccharomyces parabailii]